MSPAFGTAVLLLVGVLHTVTAQSQPSDDPTVEEKPCGDGWSGIDPEHCAKFFDSPKTFSDAEELCQSFASDLLSFHDPVQIWHVLRMILRSRPDVPSMWTAGKKLGSENVFTNIDGSQFDFQLPWLFKPDTFDHQLDCIESNSDVWGFWVPEDCNEENRFVCAKKM